MEAKDNEGSPGCHSSTVQVVIKVEDENDNPPVFDSQKYTFSISEDATYGTFVGGITATDPDFNPQLTYYIQSGADGHFLIADKTSGEIFTYIIKTNYKLFGLRPPLIITRHLRSSPRTRDIHTCCLAFCSGFVTTCYNEFGLPRSEFNLPTFRLHCSNQCDIAAVVLQIHDK